MWLTLVADARFAVRLARRNALTAAVIAVTVALGVGATTAVFGVVDAVLVRPLPFPASGRVVTISGIAPDGRDIGSVAYPDLLDFRRDVAAFSDVGTYQVSEETLERAGDPRMLRTVQVDEGYERIFSLRPAIGRLFDSTDVRVGAPPVAILSNGLWQREFGGDVRVVGTRVPLAGRSVQIVGVLRPTDFSFPRSDVDALMPLIPQPGTMMLNRGAMWAGAVAMVRPGSSVELAQRQLSTVAERISREYPKSNTGISARVRTLKDDVIGDVRQMLLLLSLAMVAVLVIACANVANVTIGQSIARRREFAVRTALGGSRSRIARQVLMEALVVVAAGGIVGVLITPLLTHLFVALYPGELPRAAEVHVNYRTLGVALVSVAVASVLAAWPTIRYATRALGDSLRGTNRATRRSATGGLLIASQVATALALIFVSVLLGRTFVSLLRTDPGFDPHNVMTFHVWAPYVRYNNRTKIGGYYDALDRQVRAIPGVTSVATATAVPFAGARFGDVFVQKELGDQGPKNPHVPINIVSYDFERALGIPVVAGRAFTARDDSTSAHVVVVNRALADRYYAGDAVGKEIQWNGEDWEIAGVVGSMSMERLDSPPEPMLFIPAAQAMRTSRYVMVRSTRPAPQLVIAIRESLRGIDRTIAMTNVMTLGDRLSESLAAQRFRAALIGGLCVLAVVLSIVGIYGVVSYAVAGRTREIGIRMALGETAGRVRRVVIAAALRTALIGALVGIVVAIWASRWLAEFVAGAAGLDVGALAGATIGVFAIVAASAFLPARRASRVDPASALRAD